MLRSARFITTHFVSHFRRDGRDRFLNCRKISHGVHGYHDLISLSVPFSCVASRLFCFDHGNLKHGCCDIYGCSFCTLESSTGPIVVPIVVYHHLLVQWLFLLYSAILFRGCSSCYLPSSTGPMVVPLVLFHHLLVQWLFLLLSTISDCFNGCPVYSLPSSTGPLVMYHRLLVQRLFQLYSTIIYWSNG